MTEAALAAAGQRKTADPKAEGRSDAGFLTIDRLGFAYGDGRPILESLSLSVGRAEFIALLGASGCGKSTLLKIISGISKPTAGEVRLAGRVVDGTRSDIGMVFQKPTLLPWRNVLDNVLLPAGFSGRASPAERDHALRLLKLVGLGDVVRAYPHQLSGGMAQRVGLARMLLHDPPLLLLDEPFAALDALTREALAFELQAITQVGDKTAVFVTHSIPEAVLLADRVIVLAGRPGKIVADVKVELDRPRDIETMASPDFNRVAHDLRAIFQGLLRPGRVS
jgi:NitT/TauT family transport system ATP-binding protein